MMRGTCHIAARPPHACHARCAAARRHNTHRDRRGVEGVHEFVGEAWVPLLVHAVLRLRMPGVGEHTAQNSHARTHPSAPCSACASGGFDSPSNGKHWRPHRSRFDQASMPQYQSESPRQAQTVTAWSMDRRAPHVRTFLCAAIPNSSVGISSTRQ